MKAIGLTEFGGPGVLRIVTLLSQEPGTGEVRIGVHTVAVNSPLDLRTAQYGSTERVAKRVAKNEWQNEWQS